MVPHILKEEALGRLGPCRQYEHSARVRSQTVLQVAYPFTNMVRSACLKTAGRKRLDPGSLIAPEVDLILMPPGGVVGQQPDPRNVAADIDVDDGAESWRDVPACSPREHVPLFIVTGHSSIVEVLEVRDRSKRAATATWRMEGLGEVCDQLDEVVAAISLSPRELNQFVSFGEHGAFRNRVTGDVDAATAAELQQAFVAKQPQGP